MRPLVIGVGNAWRGDDGVGLVVARIVGQLAGEAVEVRENAGDAAALVSLWEGRDRVLVVDAMCSGLEPGDVARFELGDDDPAGASLVTGATFTSSHAFGVAEAVALARELDALPPGLVLVGIEGERFEAGSALSPRVAEAAERVARRIAADAAAS